MKVLVTGASGFLGRHVVSALRAAGHGVRALVRPGTELAPLGWGAEIEVVHADLCDHPALGDCLADSDALVHLAATMRGSESARFEETLLGTERLLEAMVGSQVRRIVLCSSLSVYDWRRAALRADEAVPLGDASSRTGYAAAKRAQEVATRERSKAHGWSLTVLRPGTIWGPDKPCPEASIGRRLGSSAYLVFGPARRPAFSHVANCADCFRAALESPEAAGQTINVIDPPAVSAWRFLGEALRRGGAEGVRVPIPARALGALVALAGPFGRLLLGPSARLPALLRPEEYAECYRPRQHDTRRLRELLGDHRPLDFEACLALTYGGVA